MLQGQSSGHRAGSQIPQQLPGVPVESQTPGSQRVYEVREDPSVATAVNFGNVAGAGAVPRDSPLPSSIPGLEG